MASLHVLSGASGEGRVDDQMVRTPCPSVLGRLPHPNPACPDRSRPPPSPSLRPPYPPLTSSPAAASPVPSSRRPYQYLGLHTRRPIASVPSIRCAAAGTRLIIRPDWAAGVRPQGRVAKPTTSERAGAKAEQILECISCFVPTHRDDSIAGTRANTHTAAQARLAAYRIAPLRYPG